MTATGAGARYLLASQAATAAVMESPLPKELPIAPNSPPPLLRPPLGSRLCTGFVMAATGLLSKSWLSIWNSTEVIGLERFLKILDDRQDVESRQRGLITVSNHTSVVDDPLMWGVLPLRYFFNPENLRWSFASHDICFTNRFTSSFFATGQTLPMHRLAYSPLGGPFQPSMTQAIRLLCGRPFTSPSPPPERVFSSVQAPVRSSIHHEIHDPFSSPCAAYTYTTNGVNSYPAPSSYLNRRFSWVHFFPEGMIHQHPDRTMRYYKHGFGRLVLEADPLPQIVPIWIEGLDQCMHESRKWPRFIPRAFKRLRVIFGEEVDAERVFGDLRRRWQRLVLSQKRRIGNQYVDVGILDEELKYGEEAVKLRIEASRRIREEVLKLRRQSGWPDEDPKATLAETWVREGPSRVGLQKDGSWIREA